MTDSSVAMADGAVTFLDVLGWKGIWAREGDPGGAVERLRTMLKLAKEIADEFSKKNRGVTTEVKSISDTIVLQTAGAAELTLLIHATVCKQLVCKSIDLQLPLRGAVAYGRFLPGAGENDTIVVGPAVDEAASWHEATDWIGVIMTPHAALSVSAPVAGEQGWVHYSGVPLKRGRAPGILSLDWTADWAAGLDELRASFRQMGPLVPEIAPKYLNTLAFFENQRSAKERGVA